MFSYKRGRPRPIYKINSDGDIVESYAKISEAAKKNYMSYRTMFNRLNNKHCKDIDSSFRYVYIDKYEGL